MGVLNFFLCVYLKTVIWIIIFILLFSKKKMIHIKLSFGDDKVPSGIPLCQLAIMIL